MSPLLDRLVAGQRSPGDSHGDAVFSGPDSVAPASHPAATLPTRAEDAGLVVCASATWPESTADDGAAGNHTAGDHTVEDRAAGDDAPPQLAGFVVSGFSPMIAEVAARCLTRRPTDLAATGPTAIVIVSALGDVTSAAHVASAVDTGSRIGPLLFFQSVPNAVAGYIAARWRLTGPVVCVGSTSTGLAIAGQLLADGDAADALIVHVEAGTAQTGYVPSGNLPSGNLPSGSVHAGNLPSGNVHAGNLQSGDLQSGSVPAGQPVDAEIDRADARNVAAHYEETDSYHGEAVLVAARPYPRKGARP